MFRLVFFVALLLFGLAVVKLTASVSGAGGGAYDAEIDAVRNTPVERIARTGMSEPRTVDAWIAEEFYVGRFDVSWSASDIAEDVNGGKVRVVADMRSNSQLQLERSVVLRFDVDPKDKKVTFAGMVLEGAEVANRNGKPYNLEEAMAAMWERRNKTYLQDPSDDG